MPRSESQTVRELLLHRLPQSQADELSDRILEDGDFADQLELETADLLDDYARGLLNREDARRVEAHLLTGPDDARRLGFARTLAAFRPIPIGEKATMAVRPLHRRLLAVAGMAACAALILLAWLFPVVSELHHPNGVPSSADAGHHPAPVRESSAPPATPGLADFTVAFLLRNVRGGEMPAFDVPASAHTLHIECEIPRDGQFAGYRIVMRDAAGGMWTSPSNLQLQQAADIRFVAASFPIGNLASGGYNVVVMAGSSGTQVVASFNMILSFHR